MYIDISDIMYNVLLCISDNMPKGDIMGDFNQAKYIQKFQKENYDRCIFNVPKGQKAIIEEHWRSLGYKSLNAYVNDMIQRDMSQRKTGLIKPILRFNDDEPDGKEQEE